MPENRFFKTLAKGAHKENGNFYHKENSQIFIYFFGGYGKSQPFLTPPHIFISNAFLQTQAGQMLSKVMRSLDSRSTSRDTQSHLMVRAEDLWTCLDCSTQMCTAVCLSKCVHEYRKRYQYTYRRV